MFKRIFFNMLIVFLFVSVSYGMEWKYVDQESVVVKDTAIVARNMTGDSIGNGGGAGLFLGTLVSGYNKGYKVIGIGGIVVSGLTRVGEGEKITSAIGIVPITIFDDMVQAIVGYNTGDQASFIGIGLSVDKFLADQLWNTQ